MGEKEWPDETDQFERSANNLEDRVEQELDNDFAAGMTEDGLAPDAELEETMPVPAQPAAVIKARRWSRALKKQLRGWPGRMHHTSCASCGLGVVIAQSSHDELVAAAERGEVWEVICDECADELLPDVPEGLTEGQAREISKVSRTLDAQERKN